MVREPKHGLTKVIPLLLTAVSLASIILMAIIWINFEFNRAAQLSEATAKEYNEEAELLLSLETNHISEYIEAQTSASQVKFYINIKDRVLEIWNMLTGLESDPRLAGFGQDASKVMILSVLDNLAFSDGQSGYFCTTAEGEVLMGWGPAAAASALQVSSASAPPPSDSPSPDSPAPAAPSAAPASPGGGGPDAGGAADRRGMSLDPESLGRSIESVKTVGEGFYRIDLSEAAREAGGAGETPTTFLKHYEKYDWILGASSYYSDFEDDLRRELIRWADNVSLPPEYSRLIMTLDGLVLSYSDPSVVGHRLDEEGFDPDLREALGLVVERAASQGRGHLHFSLPDPTDGGPEDCIAYFRALGSWKWVVVNWVDSSVLADNLAVQQTSMRRNLTRQITRVLIITVCVLALVAVISLVLTRKLTASVSRFTRFFNEAATSSVEMDPSEQSFAELAGLAEAANKMILERREAERRVTENEVKFRTVFEVSPQVITIMDAGGVLLEGNGEFERHAGTSLERARGRSLAELLKIPAPVWTKFLDELSRRGQVVNGRELALDKGPAGGTRLLLFGKTMTFLDREFILGLGVDITELRRAEKEKLELKEKLARSQKMEAMGLMAASVAHELNNILSGLIGYPELLLRDPDLSEAQRALADDILDAGRRAADVVGDLMTLSKGVATAKVNCDLSELAASLIETNPALSSLLASRKDILVTVEKPPEPAVVRGSPAHLRKVVQNLVVNSVEAISGSDKKGGLIVVSLANVRLDGNPGPFVGFSPGDYVRLRVTDDGPGIPERDLDRVFEPFYTLKGDASRGLGLALVDLIVRDHGGAVEVKSDGKNTSFTVYLASSAERARKKTPGPLSELKGRGQKILVVDDVDIQRKLAQKMLKTLGYDPHSVSSGEEALEYLKKSDADLVILDMIMDPGINGRQTYEAILAIKPNQKAIIASGMAENDEVVRAQALGASSFVAKPYSIEDIAGAVYKALHAEA
ncbi:MAG: cache domain-containing protein [Deltaproteobacteria bacterium]|jgi:PAS domain S-box-containing protein|nr:cache domain-containing protein [Deltaproteobacteria bacterium]